LAAGICRLDQTTGGGLALEKTHIGQTKSPNTGSKGINMTTEIGTNPLPLDVQQKLGEFLDLIEEKYEIKHGATALYWSLSYLIAKEIVRE
jgi:hypothetical protein